MVTRRLACDKSSARSHNCSRQDFYAFASVCGLETFVLSDRMYTCFSFLHNTHTSSLCIPLASSLRSVYTTFAPLLESIQPYVQVFHQLQYNTQLEFFSAGKIRSAVLSPRAWIMWCFYFFLCVVGFIYSGVEKWTILNFFKLSAVDLLLLNVCSSWERKDKNQKLFWYKNKYIYI